MCPLEHRHKCVSGCPSLEPLSTGKKRERCIPPERVATLPVCRQTRSPGTSAVAQAGNRYWPVASARNEEQSPGPMSAHLTFFACCKGRGRGEIAPGAANCSPPSPRQCQEAGTEPTLASPPCRFPPAKASSCFRPRLWRSCQDGVVCHGVAMERARAQGQRRPHPGGGTWHKEEGAATAGMEGEFLGSFISHPRGVWLPLPPSSRVSHGNDATGAAGPDRPHCGLLGADRHQACDSC